MSVLLSTIRLHEFAVRSVCVYENVFVRSVWVYMHVFIMGVWVYMNVLVSDVWVYKSVLVWSESTVHGVLIRSVKLLVRSISVHVCWLAVSTKVCWLTVCNFIWVLLYLSTKDVASPTGTRDHPSLPLRWKAPPGHNYVKSGTGDTDPLTFYPWFISCNGQLGTLIIRVGRHLIRPRHRTMWCSVGFQPF